MDIFSILTMVGGLALFPYGMEVLGDGLKKMSGGKLEIILPSFEVNTIFFRRESSTKSPTNALN